jgi:pantoate--beta-alanine ligase
VRLSVVLRRALENEPLVALDYAEIVDAETLEPVLRLRRSCLVLLAAFVGATRLIDNALVEEEGDSFRVSL